MPPSTVPNDDLSVTERVILPAASVVSSLDRLKPSPGRPCLSACAKAKLSVSFAVAVVFFPVRVSLRVFLYASPSAPNCCPRAAERPDDPVVTPLTSVVEVSLYARFSVGWPLPPPSFRAAISARVPFGPFKLRESLWLNDRLALFDGASRPPTLSACRASVMPNVLPNCGANCLPPRWKPTSMPLLAVPPL